MADPGGVGAGTDGALTGRSGALHGSRRHAGGKHWTSQDAEEWRTLAAWVRGRTGR